MMLLADTLSRAYLPVNSYDVIHSLEAVDHTCLLPLTLEHLHQIRHVSAAADTTPCFLYDMVLDGWPSYREDIPISLIPDWDYHN